MAGPSGPDAVGSRARAAPRDRDALRAGCRKRPWDVAMCSALYKSSRPFTTAGPSEGRLAALCLLACLLWENGRNANLRSDHSRWH